MSCTSSCSSSSSSSCSCLRSFECCTCGFVWRRRRGSSPSALASLNLCQTQLDWTPSSLLISISSPAPSSGKRPPPTQIGHLHLGAKAAAAAEANAAAAAAATKSCGRIFPGALIGRPASVSGGRDAQQRRAAQFGALCCRLFVSVSLALLVGRIVVCSKRSGRTNCTVLCAAWLRRANRTLCCDAV